MIHSEKKIAKIVEELTIFFFAVGATQIQSSIKKENRDVIITFQSDYQQYYQERVDRLREYLNEPKNEAIEDEYWELAGSGEPGEAHQIILVGMMIDQADILIEDTFVSLKLYKKLQEWE